MHDLDARHRRLDDEGRDLLDRLSLDELLGGPRHHYEQLGPCPIGAPELFAIDYEMLAIFGWRRRAAHVGGIGSRIDFGQRKRRDRALCESRKILALLRFGAEQLERLRDSD